ncbi:histidine triad nucleotide-binding protein [Caldisalinibacter kiritimatiensis]|uniref:HIT family hydrolase n=1 Tax=Caldisalinibacter kiritimatiensis TaxID=1304284 RepID=R1AVX6_9FIRM|nr:histidine triad nucleotide-binding protein [Caldisalinibacter kiritimatiensis]EOD00802.1 HIT family hydrolase [Caldisalinibacter kiritimatiensis]
MNDCIFCKIVKGEIPANKVYEDEKVIAFEDIEPQAPVHILVIPKEHITSINDINEENSDIIGHIHLVIKTIAKEKGINEKGYRVVTNSGKEGGQTVFHLHYHLLGGRNMMWPPG